MAEVWKDIPGYEGLYQVSDLGRVRSLERWRYNPKCKDGKQYVPEKILKAAERTGYLVVAINKNGKRKSYSVHRLVAQAFIPNPENKRTVNHKDGNKKNNRVSNLEWNTDSENVNHAIITGLLKFENNRKGSKEVEQYDKNMNLIATYPSMREAERAGFKEPKICLCCNGKRKFHGGYIWKYAEEKAAE